MADREEFDDPWKPGNAPPEDDPLELPEPDITPPDIGGLERVEPPQQALPQPDMLLPLPGQEGTSFSTGDEGSQSQPEGGGIQELVQIGERAIEALEEIKGVLEELLEKSGSNTGTYGP